MIPYVEFNTITQYTTPSVIITTITQWISSHLHLLRPPVGNSMIWGDQSEYKIMIVGGPNTRSDYHVEQGEEWFYMIKGSMVLKIIDNGIFKNIVINQGESYLLPPNIPHSPQRPGINIHARDICRYTDSYQLN